MAVDKAIGFEPIVSTVGGGDRIGGAAKWSGVDVRGVSPSFLVPEAL